MEFIELSSFTKRLKGRLDKEEYRNLQSILIGRPDTGTVIPGSSGIRKMRFKAMGRGANKGVRVIYYWLVAKDKIYFFDIYGKHEKTDLTRSEIRELASIVEILKNL